MLNWLSAPKPLDYQLRAATTCTSPESKSARVTAAGAARWPQIWSSMPAGAHQNFLNGSASLASSHHAKRWWILFQAIARDGSTLPLRKDAHQNGGGKEYGLTPNLP